MWPFRGYVCLKEGLKGYVYKSRWWFYFLFSSLFGEDSYFDYSNIFQDGLKPPTRNIDSIGKLRN